MRTLRSSCCVALFTLVAGACGDDAGTSCSDCDGGLGSDSDAATGQGQDGGAGSDLGAGNPLFPKAFDVGVTYTTTRYVSPTGSDQSGAGSMAAPYQSLTRALQGAAPGLQVIMLAGTYPAQGSFSGLQGSATAPIAIRGQGAVIIEATAGPTGMSFSDPRYLVLESLTIQGSPVHGINIDDGGTYATPAEHVVLRDIHLRQIGSGDNNDCLKMSGVDHFYIERSEFSGCNVGEAIDMVGCHDGVITANDFHDTPGTAVQTKGGSSDVLIHGNRFRNVMVHAVNLGGSTGDPFVRPLTAPYEGERIHVVANVIQDSAEAAVAFQGANDCLVANNTIVSPAHWVVRILQGSRDSSIVLSRNGQFVNNLIYYRRADLSVITNVGGNTEPATFTFGNNLYFASDGVAFNGDHGSAIPLETGSVFQQDPGFAGLAASDFQIGATSPAAGRGRALPFGRTLFHIDQSSPASPPDVGAHRAQ